MPANPANPANRAAGEQMEPQPLFRECEPGQEFPTDALGKPLAAAVRAIVDIVQCPSAIAAGSILGALSLACQAHADVVLPIGSGRPVPLSLFLVTVAESGERKSSADELAMKPVAAFERELASEHSAKFPEFSASMDAWKASKAKALKNAKGDWKAGERAILAIGAEPQPPMTPILTVGEPTMQGIARHFETGRSSVGLMDDEGGKMLGGWAMNADNRTGTITALNGLWGGGPIKKMRAGDGAGVMHGRRLALHLMLQPVLAPKLFADREIDGVGLLARFLVSAPAPIAGTRMQRPCNSDSMDALEDYGEQLTAILRMPTLASADDPRQLTPRPLRLAADATDRWREYADECERRLKAGEAWEPIKAWGSKAAEHASRLAGNLAMFHDPQTREMDLASLERGIALAEYYASEMLRLHGDAGISAGLREADELRRWLIQRSESRFALQLVYQLGPNRFRSGAKARAACLTLEAHGHLIPLAEGEMIDGKRVKEGWRVVRN